MESIWDFLSSPIWQGIGAIAGVFALLCYIYVERERVFPSQTRRVLFATLEGSAVGSLFGAGFAIVWSLLPEWLLPPHYVVNELLFWALIGLGYLVYWLFLDRGSGAEKTARGIMTFVAFLSVVAILQIRGIIR